jgi:hypothetical protein
MQNDRRRLDEGICLSADPDFPLSVDLPELHLTRHATRVPPPLLMLGGPPGGAQVTRYSPG